MVAASAQAAPLPTFSVTINASSITVGAAPKSGAVNVLTSVSGLKEAGAILFLLKPGVTYAEVESFLASKKKGQGDPNRASKYGSLVFDAEAERGPRQRSADLPAARAVPRAGDVRRRWRRSSTHSSPSQQPLRR